MNRKQRDANRSNAARLARTTPSKCPNCGGQGPHFVPPSFGQSGFYICEAAHHIGKPERTCGACGKAGCVAGECSTVGINGLTEAETGVAQTAIHTLNKAFEDGLEALRVCTGEMLSQRTKGKVERAITAMCNAMPILDLVEGVNVKELGGLTTIYQQLLPVDSSGKKAA